MEIKKIWIGKKSSSLMCRLPYDVQIVRRTIAGNTTAELKENENFSSSGTASSVLPPKITKIECNLVMLRCRWSEYIFMAMLFRRANVVKKRCNIAALLDL